MVKAKEKFSLRDFFIKVNGKVSITSIVNILVFILGVLEIVTPYVPKEYLSYLVIAVAIINLYLRMVSDGSSLRVNKYLLKI